MTDYTTLDLTKTEIQASSTVDDSQVRRYIRQVSRRIDATMSNSRRPYFAPYTEQRSFPIETSRVDSWANNTFDMRDPLFSFTEVLRQTTDMTSQVALYSWNNEVAHMLRITNCTQSWYYNCDCTQPFKIHVTGIWGWHEDYDNAYASVDTVQDAGGINASVTSITVSDADGSDLDGFTPRFSPGNLILIGSELLDVTAVNTTTNVLTVRRGVNGTTAAIHSNGDAVKIYQVDERIQRIATRQAALLYARQGAFQVETLDGVGVVTYPQDLLTELRNVLMEFQYT